MLRTQECVAFQNLFIFLDRIDIDISEFPDRIL